MGNGEWGGRNNKRQARVKVSKAGEGKGTARSGWVRIIGVSEGDLGGLAPL